MKYQKIIPATKPIKIQIPDQKTLTAYTRVIIGKERRATQGARNALPRTVHRITYQHHG